VKYDRHGLKFPTFCAYGTENSHFEDIFPEGFSEQSDRDSFKYHRAKIAGVKQQEISEQNF
jgi:hypothetical protein